MRDLTGRPALDVAVGLSFICSGSGREMLASLRSDAHRQGS
jgi:hypothetical protein